MTTTTLKPIPEMTPTEVECELAERVYGEPAPTGTGASQKDKRAWLVGFDKDDIVWVPKPFCSDFNATHALWGMLTPEQKEKVAFGVPARRSIYYSVGFVDALNANADTLSRWILEAVRKEAGK